jgi:AmiR/NasT family two-component response regulator
MSANTKISLLLIDTDQTAMDICRKIIGFKFPELIVHCSCDVHEAAILFNDNKHHILMIDVFIADNRRFDIAHKVCAEKPDTLILFIAEDPVINRHYIESKAKELCLYGIINKPVDVVELFNAIAVAVAIIPKRIDGHAGQSEKC